MKMTDSRGARTAAVLGASPKAGRYSNMAVRRLKDAGYPVIPVNPAYEAVEGLRAVSTVCDAADEAGGEGLETLTLYLAPHHLEPLTDDILKARPRRVIFNPGTESSFLQAALDEAGIPWMEACTLVLLSTGQY
jgi:predicted CoA-binding protein